MVYLLLLGVIAVGAGLLLVYYSLQDKKTKKVSKDIEPEDKGKVIYMFDDKDGDDTKPEPEVKKTSADESDNKKEEDKAPEEPTKKDD